MLLDHGNRIINPQGIFKLFEEQLNYLNDNSISKCNSSLGNRKTLDSACTAICIFVFFEQVKENYTYFGHNHMILHEVPQTT